MRLRLFLLVQASRLSVTIPVWFVQAQEATPSSGRSKE
jgi:hypothetical protein